MKKLALSILILLTAGFSSLQAQSKETKTSQPAKAQEASAEELKKDSDPRQQVSIAPRELPAEARRDITDNYHNPEILNAYKLMLEGKLNGYLVEVKKGPKKWTIEFDDKGNAVNKIPPF